MGGIRTWVLVQIIYLYLFVNADTKTDTIVVTTGSGKVSGVEVKSILKDEKYYSFMGIPYGKPLHRESRFTEPQPHEGWTEVLEAKREKKVCPQNNVPVRSVNEHGYTGDEDCLHLSIHTPKLPNNDTPNLPVIVFLYNEHFRITHNGTREYGPDFFMKENVVFVTISYRVGSLGFLSYEDDFLPGNNGLRDVILALKWIQNNIQAFGGNPFRITLMGVKGGAAIAEFLMHSPKAKGLFSGVILHSGTAWNSVYLPDNAKKKADSLAEVLEVSSVNGKNFVNNLSRFPTMEIVLAEITSVVTDQSREEQRATEPFGPVIEPDHPDAIITKRLGDAPIDISIPVMIGYNSREGLELAERFLRKPQYLTFADRDFVLLFPIRVDYRFDMFSNIYAQAIEEIKKFYFEEGYVKISKPGEYMTFIADMVNFYAIDYAVRRYSNETTLPVYYYTFDYSGDLNMMKQQVLDKALTIEGSWGANAGDELCYLLVCKGIKKKYRKVLDDEDSEELKVIRNMVKMWTNFAKTGSPTPIGNDFNWVPASKDNKECLVISDELQMKNNLHEDRIKFWDDFMAKYKALAVNGIVKDVNDEL